MERRGVSLIELVIASVVLMTVVTLGYMLHLTWIRSYKTTTNLSSARLQVQSSVDRIVEDVQETKLSWIWKCAVTGEFTSSEEPDYYALVIWSPRDPDSGTVVPGTDMGVRVYETIAYVPLKDSDGNVHLHRFRFGANSYPAGVASDYPTATIAVSNGNVALQFVKADSSYGFVSAPSVAETDGTVVAKNLRKTRFLAPNESGNDFDVYDDDGAGGYQAATYHPTGWVVGLTCRATVETGEKDVEVSTVVMPRN